MTKILVLDEIAAAGLDILRSEKSFEVQEIYREDPQETRKALASFCRETLKPLRHKARLAIRSARIVDLKP
jgi:hypothetical protein